MKYEAFEEAAEIKKNIDVLRNLDSLLCNAAHGKNKLAALKPMSYEESQSDRIINEEPLSLEMLASFREILNKKIGALRSEFESL